MPQKKSEKIFVFLTVSSVCGIICLLISDFFGGLIIWLLILRWLYIPLISIYLISAVITIYRMSTRPFQKNKIVFFSHSFGLIAILSFILYNADFYKSPIILDTVLMDDLSSIRISYRKNGEFVSTTTGMFGYREKVSGQYLIIGDTIRFMDYPYSNDLIPKELLIVKSDSAVFFIRDENNHFLREKAFAHYFKISQME